jgi:hypothetical protein
MPVDQNLGHVNHVKRLLANPCSHHLIRWEQPLPCEDDTSSDMLTFPVGNYVNENLVRLGNYLNADTLPVGLDYDHAPTVED